MSQYAKSFDVIVVGAGHAGCEAASATARMGLQTLLLGMNLDTVAAMSCNPAIGGLAKGHLVREIDALGGIMGRAADACGIQFKMLNTSRGPAVQAPRAQCDKFAYRQWVKRQIECTPNLTLKQATVESLVVDAEGKAVLGVKTKTGTEYRGKAVILTTGTFLQGLIHIGDLRIQSGRAGEPAAVGLSASLKEMGFELGRLKTGTNPRVDSKTLDFSKFEVFPGDDNIQPFSYSTPRGSLSNKATSWTVKTNQAVHDTIAGSMVRSPLYNGAIKGIGPRYCPSIEDKVMRFPEKSWHQIIIEPEGLDTNELYLNGLSTSLPEADQLRFLRQIDGFENAEIMRPGYAVEYDFVPPTQLNASLAARGWKGLYLAGQINGTSGYEEAAGQGLLAGINAGRWVKDQAPVVLGRDQAYLGVLVDDLITKGTAEPYRLFTSLAEFRLLLRQDNADWRLMDLGHEFGLVPDDVYGAFTQRRTLCRAEMEKLEKTWIKATPTLNQRLAELESAQVTESITLANLLKRPEIRYPDLGFLESGVPRGTSALPADVTEQAEIQIKYDGYIRRQLAQVEQFKKLEERRLPETLDYQQLYGLADEARQKLKKIRPLTVGQASRISGVSPSDVSVILIYLEAHKPGSVLTVPEPADTV
jgi:tRNA uridine 5-carboxymethylaminomethyl modification enzyme